MKKIVNINIIDPLEKILKMTNDIAKNPQDVH